MDRGFVWHALYDVDYGLPLGEPERASLPSATRYSRNYTNCRVVVTCADAEPVCQTRIENTTARVKLDDERGAHPCVVNGAATASCFGFNATDSTELLQAALNLETIRTLTVDAPVGCNAARGGSCVWIVRPLYITRHNLLVIFEEGVTLLAKRDEFHGLDDSLLKIEGAANISLQGRPGSALKMRRADYAVPSWGSCPTCRPYTKAEWRAGIWIAGCRNVTLAGLTVAETGGDGLYIDDLNHGKPNNLISRDIHVVDCVFDRNWRQGCSVISAINLLVERCTFSNTNGTDPSASILSQTFPRTS